MQLAIKRLNMEGEIMSVGESIHDTQDKNEQGKNKPASICMGIVKDNYNAAKPGHVLVNILADGGKKILSDWMPVAVPYAANKCGVYLMPEVGSTVIIGYVDDNSVSPVVIGSVWHDKGDSRSKIPADAVNKDNSVKVFSFSKGMMIKFDESEKNQSIEIISGEKQRIFLDDKNKRIEFSSSKDDKIILDGNKGEISIEAKNSVKISVGGKQTVEISSEGIKVKSDKLNYEGNVMQLKGNQTKLEGSAVEVKSSGDLKITSSGMAAIKGSMLKLN